MRCWDPSAQGKQTKSPFFDYQALVASPVLRWAANWDIWFGSATLAGTKRRLGSAGWVTLFSAGQCCLCTGWWLELRHTALTTNSETCSPRSCGGLLTALWNEWASHSDQGEIVESRLCECQLQFKKWMVIMNPKKGCYELHQIRETQCLLERVLATATAGCIDSSCGNVSVCAAFLKRCRRDSETA